MYQTDCPKCGGLRFDAGRAHRCPPVWLCQVEGVDPDAPSRHHAVDAATAAEAERLAYDEDEPDASEVTVVVTPARGGPTQRFAVIAAWDRYATARELDGDTDE